MAIKTHDSFSDKIITVLQRIGKAWRAVVVQADSGGVKLLEARQSDQGPSGIIDSLAAKHGRGRVVRIIPGTASVCRIGTVAMGSEPEMLAAIGLVAEAILPTGVPAHRRSAGVLPAVGPVVPTAAGQNPEARVLATAWIGQAEAPATNGKNGGGKSRRPAETWISEVGALAGALNGQGLAAWIDADAGTIGVLAAGVDRTIARQLLGDTSSTQSWQSTVGAVLDESVRGAGLPAVETVDAGTRTGLVLSPAARTSLREAVKGITGDDRWMEQFGLCLCGAVVASGAGSMRPLAQMIAEAPKVREAVPLRSAGWLSDRGRAKRLIIAGLAVLLIGPGAFAFARYSVLKSKTSGLDNQKTTREQTTREAALYSQLEVSRWPITKLLADVSAATPVDVVAETISISTETGLKIVGKAKKQELVNELQANLNATTLFRNVKVGRTESGEDGVEFDVTAEVANPHNKVSKAEDYIQKTLAVRMYGDGADNTKEAPVVDKSKPSRASRGDDSGKEGADRTTRRGAEEGPPVAITDAEIGKMDHTTAMREWSKRKTYVQKNPTLDTATKDRLNAEVPKLREQMEKMRASAGGKP
ncbi:MAG: PilN domain-containing protein [Phycisphaerales bacterium]|nr:PilN domain-containing protein [Phycisphaerales bacterium]